MTLTQSMLVTFVLLEKIRVHSTITNRKYVSYCSPSFVIIVIIVIIFLINIIITITMFSLH